MSTLDKAKQRLLSTPKDYTYTEAKSLLQKLGYIELDKGSTSGSRVMFINMDNGTRILMHKPHPSNIMTIGAVKDLIRNLRRLGDI